MIELKKCPFCGNKKLKLIRKSKLFGFNGLDERIETHSFYVRCNKCFSRGTIVSGKVCSHYVRIVSLERPSWETTDEKLEKQAIKLWNSRAELNNSNALNALDALKKEKRE